MTFQKINKKLFLSIVALLATQATFAEDNCYQNLPGTGEAKKPVPSDCLAPKPLKVVGGSMTSMSLFSHEIELNNPENPKNMFNQYADQWTLVKPAKETEEWKERLNAVAKNSELTSSAEDTKKLLETANLKTVKTRMEFDQVIQRRCLLFTASPVCAKVGVKDLVSCKGKANEIVARASSKGLSPEDQGKIILEVLQEMGYGELSQKISEKSLSLLKKYIPYVGKGVDYVNKAKNYWDNFQKAKEVATEVQKSKTDGGEDVTWAKAFDKAMKDRESEHLCYPGDHQFRAKVRMVLGAVKGQTQNEINKKKKANASPAANADDGGLLPFGIGKGSTAD